MNPRAHNTKIVAAALASLITIASVPALADDMVRVTPAATFSVPATVAFIGHAKAPDPCKHKMFCGPISLLPHDPHERALKIAELAFSAVDGLVSIAGYNQWNKVCLTCSMMAGLPRYAGFKNVTTRDYAGTPAESNPAVQPFSHGGFGILALGGVAAELFQGAFERTWSVRAREAVSVAEIGSHAWGIQSWRAADQRVQKLEQTADVCNTIGHEARAAAASPTLSTTVNGFTYSVAQINASYVQCNQFIFGKNKLTGAGL
jgi:hypothetical protein